MIARAPGPRLAPFVSMIWAQDGSHAVGRERVLPTGQMHLVVRIEGQPVAIARTALRGGCDPMPAAVVGGTRDGFYDRVLGGRSSVVGAMLRPGAATALLGAPADVLAGAHIALADLWCPADVAALRERLAEARGEAARLGVFAEALEARLSAEPSQDFIPFAATWLSRGGSVRALAERVDCSHRHLTERFRAASGLTPKLFQRLARFNRLIDAMAGSVAAPADLAADHGYADQAHMIRDFRAFAGVTPAIYLASRPIEPRHLPLR